MVASQCSCRWIRLAAFASARMSSELLLAAPSVPSRTSTPASRLAGYDIVPPVAYFWLLIGQWTACVSRSARILISRFVTQPQCAHTVPGWK